MTLTFPLILFVLVSAGILLGGITKFYGMGFTTGAILFAIGAGYFILMYGIRWFGSDQSVFSAPPGSWPPTVNMCPDFLTYYERTDANGKKMKTCIDRIGVSRNGALSVFPSSGPAPVDDKFYFVLDSSNADPTVSRNAMCQKAITMGLTWEGITNGESCVQEDGTVGSASGAGGDSNCQCP